MVRTADRIALGCAGVVLAAILGGAGGAVPGKTAAAENRQEGAPSGGTVVKEPSAQPAAAAPAKEPPSAGTVTPKEAQPQPPVHIDAEQAEYYNKENRALFTGKVVMTQGDATLTAERVEVFFTRTEEPPQAAGGGPGAAVTQPAPTGAVTQPAPTGTVTPPASTGTVTQPGGTLDQTAEQSRIKSMIATKSVTFRQVDPGTGNERYATGDRAEYEAGPRTVTLTGNPRAWENKNVMTGEVMIFSIEDRNVTVKGKAGLTVYPSNKPAGAPEPPKTK